MNRKKTNNENDKGKKRTQTIRIKFQVAHNISRPQYVENEEANYKENVIKIKFYEETVNFY